MESGILFEKVLAQCGFSSVLGPGIVRRALADEGVTPENAKPEDYRRALPRLQARMTAYMTEATAIRRIRRIAGLLAFADGTLQSEDERDWSTYGRALIRSGTDPLGDSDIRDVDLDADTLRANTPRPSPSINRKNSYRRS